MSQKLKTELDVVATCYFNDEGNIKFDPPVYHQRYMHVEQILRSHPAIEANVKKLVEFGCAEMKFFYSVKHQLPGVREFLEVDIDEALLIGSQYRVEPLTVDYMDRRPAPLKVDIYCGSVSDSSEVLKGTDAVIAIELIEHLFPETLDGVPDNVFGYMQPKVAVFTTPNSEINGIFPGLVGFRHDDHKFEWTRAEFAAWANEICTRFPRYSVEFYGIGPGPKGTESMGCVSQMAVFLRDDMRNLIENWDASVKPELDPAEMPDKMQGLGSYKLIASIVYPVDDRTEAQKIIDEAKYRIHQLEMEFREEDNSDVVFIPLELIFTSRGNLAESRAQLREMLIEDGFTVIDDKIELKEISRWSSYEQIYEQVNDLDLDADNENNQNQMNVDERQMSAEEDNWDS